VVTLFAFWIPLSILCVWMLTLAKLPLNAIKAGTPEAERAEARA
jgi:hypothetical protein